MIGQRVLVVDDGGEVRGVLRRFLESERLEICEASSAEARCLAFLGE